MNNNFSFSLFRSFQVLSAAQFQPGDSNLTLHCCKDHNEKPLLSCSASTNMSALWLRLHTDCRVLPEAQPENNSFIFPHTNLPPLSMPHLLLYKPLHFFFFPIPYFSFLSYPNRSDLKFTYIWTSKFSPWNVFKSKASCEESSRFRRE